MKAFVAIAVTAVFCLSFGFSISQNLGASSILIALSDSEMIQRTGGAQHGRAELKSNWKNSFRNCSLYTAENCPSGATEVTYPQFRCISCQPNYLDFALRSARKTGKSWCTTTDVWRDGEWVTICENRWRTLLWWTSCIDFKDFCPTSS